MVANTIGAGIYTTSGYTLADMGQRQGVLAVWLLAAVLALSGAVSFGALARAIPQSGGEYLYLSRLFHPALGFVAGWISLIAGFAGAQAFAALTFAEYLQWQETPHLAKAAAVALLISLALTQGLLVRIGTLLQNLAVIAKGLFLAVFIFLGWWLLPEEVGSDGVLTGDPWAWPLNIMWVSLSFTGYNSAIYVAEECQNPRRDIPRALLMGTAITALLYLAINIVFMYSAPIESMKLAPDIALISASSLGGQPLLRAVQGLVLLSLLTLLSGIAVAGPRVLVKMGQDGFLPPLTLGQAAVIQCTLAVTMTVWSNLLTQISFLSLTLGLSSAAAVACTFKLSKEKRPPMIFPVFYLTVTALACLAFVRLRPNEGLATLITVSTGLLVYRLFFHHKHRAA